MYITAYSHYIVDGLKMQTQHNSFLNSLQIICVPGLNAQPVTFHLPPHPAPTGFSNVFCFVGAGLVFFLCNPHLISSSSSKGDVYPVLFSVPEQNSL